MADEEINWVRVGYPRSAQVVVDDIREVLERLCERLTAGAEGAGATLTLTADECAKVLGCIKYPPNLKGRPLKVEDGILAGMIAVHCRGQEEGGASPKSAIESTMRLFGCKRSKVYAALRMLPPSK